MSDHSLMIFAVKQKGELMDDMMTFPETVEEFMEQYKITDTEKIYTNGTDLVPIFRMKQWFEHIQSVPFKPCTVCQEFDCSGCKFRRGA